MQPKPPTPDAEAGAAASPNGLLKRYLLPVGLFDEPLGDIFATHAARRRNRDRMRRFMPHYARVHSLLALLMLGVCSTAEASEASAWLVAAAIVPTAGELMLAMVFVCMVAVLRVDSD